MKQQTKENELISRKTNQVRRKWSKALIQKELVALHKKGHAMREDVVPAPIIQIDDFAVQPETQVKGSFFKQYDIQ